MVDVNRTDREHKLLNALCRSATDWVSEFEEYHDDPDGVGRRYAVCRLCSGGTIALEMMEAVIDQGEMYRLMKHKLQTEEGGDPKALLVYCDDAASEDKLRTVWQAIEGAVQDCEHRSSYQSVCFFNGSEKPGGLWPLRTTI